MRKHVDTYSEVEESDKKIGHPGSLQLEQSKPPSINCGIEVFFPSETGVTAMNGIKLRQGILDLVVNNSAPVSFFHTCISKHERRNVTKVFAFFV